MHASSIEPIVHCLDSVDEKKSKNQSENDGNEDLNTKFITKVAFSPKSDELLCSSGFDGNLKSFKVEHDQNIISMTGEIPVGNKIPIIDFLFNFDNEMKVYVGSMSGKILSIDMEKQAECTIGKHEKSISKLTVIQDQNILVSGSWDSSLKFWDLREKLHTSVESTLLSQPGRVFCMDSTGNQVVVATSGRHIIYWDVRHLHEPLVKTKSPLKCQIKSLACIPNEFGYVVGTNEGKVAVEYLKPPIDDEIKGYKFRCHRYLNKKGIANVYAINDIKFHPKQKCFATAGTDGKTFFWDHTTRSRTAIFQSFPFGVYSLGFSSNGNYLTGAVNYTRFDADEIQRSHSEKMFAIFVQELQESDYMPRVK